MNVKHKFTGQEYDAETGLYFYKSRYYDPILCRFISPDSIVPSAFDPQALNRYSYCKNNPIMYTDPSGHFWTIFLNALVGALVNGTVSAMTGGDFWKGAATGFVSAFAFGVAGSFIDAPTASFTAIEKAGIHFAAGSISGGINAAITGGDIGRGMLSGGLSAGLAEYTGVNSISKNDYGGQLVGRSLVGGITAGTVSALYGGNFWQGFGEGAKNAAYGYVFNSLKDQLKIKETFDKVVKQMTEQGQRFSNPYINNATRSLGLSHYLSCGEQEEVVTNALKANQYDDKWDFEGQSGYPDGLPHMWGTATSSNPNDPFIKYDPWKNTIEFNGVKQ